MTYRIRYFDRLQQHAILDLMIADDTNPHSLAFRLSELAKHVDALPSRDKSAADRRGTTRHGLPPPCASA